MKVTIENNLSADLTKPLDISIPVRFEGARLRAFGAEPPTSTPYRAGEFTLSVAEGAGCNCEVFQFSAHLHGTHTECVGHISKQKHLLHDVLPKSNFLRALLVTVKIERGLDSKESYALPFQKDDTVVSSDMLRAAWKNERDIEPEALIIRTVPNSSKKIARDYSQEPPAFLTTEAMEFVVKTGITHLLVDLPSVDRAEDEGLLSNHHLYWGVQQGSHAVSAPSSKTITELVYVPDEIGDGAYLLDLRVGNIRSDAAPSTPTLYRLA